MKLLKPISTLSLLAIIAIVFNACFKFDDPPRQEPATFDSGKITSIADFKALYTAGRPVTIQDSIIISGKVVSSDRGGNFFRELFIQDETGGIKIKLRRSGLHNFYRLGQTIYVNCLCLTLGAYAGTMELGTQSVDPRNETGFIEDPWMIDRHILPGIQGSPVEPNMITLSELNRDLIGTLVKIENLTFSRTTLITPVNPPYSYDTIFSWAVPFPSDGSVSRTANQLFSSGSQSIIVRTSGFAGFAGDMIPRRTVSLTGILTIFNNDFQLVLRDLNDVQ